MLNELKAKKICQIVARKWLFLVIFGRSEGIYNEKFREFEVAIVDFEDLVT